MTLTRRVFMPLPIALPSLHFVARAGVSEPLYFPLPDGRGGWRTLASALRPRVIGGIDRVRLDDALEYVKTASRHGGLLVLRHGHLAYEKCFGRACQEARPNLHSIGKMFTSVSCGILLSELLLWIAVRRERQLHLPNFYCWPVRRLVSISSSDLPFVSGKQK